MCFEKTDQIGGLWCYREDGVEGVGSVMKSTITNNSKEMSAFSDFPPPKDFPIYMHNSYLLQYFEMYAENFDLIRHIRSRHDILKVAQNHDFDETGRWKITVRDIENDVHFDEIFHGVMVCTCPNVYLSVRNGCWIIPRNSVGGEPLDASLFRRWWNLIWLYTPYKLLSYVVDMFVRKKKTDHSPYCFRCNRSILGQRSTINDDLQHVIQSGAVTVKVNNRKFTEKGVVFEGEETEYEVDIVILATGYDIKFQFLNQKIFSIRKQHKIKTPHSFLLTTTQQR
ncbi:flavin-containing monooxygenase 5-like [Tachypleus tridentatus]|uniref:flavin-containing monooxygenase 5-like n=1 Tax=Tachypleus tridentatus TaxID=6853 RepID=UPI003FCF171A